MDIHLTVIINFQLPLSQAYNKILSGYKNMVVKATDIEDNQGINLVNSFSHTVSYFKLPQSN